jgi:hypothetical protein
MSMGWDYVSELRPPTGLLFIPRCFMSMENHGGITLTGKPRKSKENMSQCQFVHHKSRMDTNPGLHGERPENNRLSHVTATSRLLTIQWVRYSFSRDRNVKLIVQLHAVPRLRLRPSVRPYPYRDSKRSKQNLSITVRKFPFILPFPLRLFRTTNLAIPLTQLFYCCNRH